MRCQQVGAGDVGGAEVLARHLVDRAVDPRRRVDAVGDAADRHLDVVEARPQAVEHLAADDTVQLRDAVGALRETQAHDGHVEDAGLAALVVLGAEGEQSVDGHAGDGAGAAEEEVDLGRVEAVDAGGHRRVRREDGRGADGLERLVEGEAVVADELGDALDAEEAGVALVGVVDLRRRRAATGATRGAARARRRCRGAAPARGGCPRRRRRATRSPCASLVVAGHVGVEQQQRHAADLGLPDVGVQLTRPAGRLIVTTAGVPSSSRSERERQPVGVEHGVGLDLPAVARQGLLEVAGLVEQADADDRHAEVGRGLEVVAGEDAETAGVLREDGRDAELRAEVGDRASGLRGRRPPAHGSTPGTSARS